ncbi:MAG: hypothetical protein KKD01_19825 [Proteobacteria bacterium]|nr:hypothetical protein [Pseudomonadota bacterium]
MATQLPGADATFGARQAPRPSTSVAQIGATGLEGQSAQYMGEAAGEMGQATKYLEKAQTEFDTLEAENAYNQYQEKLVDEAYGENGWTKVKGRDATDPQFQTRFEERFDTSRQEIAGKLHSPRAQQMFNQRAAVGALRSRASLMEHASKERTQYQAQVWSKGVENELNDLWRNYGDPDAFKSSLARMEGTTREYAQSQGMSEEATKDVLGQIKNKAYKQRFDAAIAADDTDKAKQIRDEATGILDSSTKLHMDEKLKVSVRAQKTVVVADEAWGKFAPTNPNDPVQIASMDAYVREKYPNDPELVKSIRQELVSRAGLWNQQQVEVNAGAKTEVLKQYNSGVPLSQLRKTDAWQSMNPADQQVLAEHIIDRGYTMQQRARADRAYTEGEKAKTAMPAFWAYSDPDVLKTMTRNQITALEPVMGPQLVQQLINKKDAFDKNPFIGKVERNLIEDWVVKNTDIKHPKAAGAKERVNGLSAWADQELSRQQAETGRKFTPEEKVQVLDKALMQQVTVNPGFFSNLFGGQKQYPASMVMPGEREGSIVPIGQIPATVQTDYVNYIRSLGRYPGFSDAAIKGKINDQIEKAYAARRTGASRIEIERILKGE